MSESTPRPIPSAHVPFLLKARRILEALSLHHFHRIVAMMLATATLVLAVVTYLEVEAHSNAETAGSDAQLRQIAAATTEINGKNQVNFDWTNAYRTWLELDLQAQSADLAKDTASRDRYIAERDKIRAESALLGKDYFPDAKDGAGPADSGEPDVSRYEVDTYYRRVQVLNEEADGLNEIKEYWHKRQSGFLSALAFLSSALFITGLALTTPRVLARGLVITGAVIILGATVYAVRARLGQEPRLNEDAIAAYAEGKSLAYQSTSEPGYNKAIEQFGVALKKDAEYLNALVARADAQVDAGILVLGTQPDAAREHFHHAIDDFNEARDLGHDDARSLWNIGWVYYLMGDYDNAIKLDTEAVKQDPELFVVSHNLGLAYLVRGKPGDEDLAMQSFEASRTEAINQITSSGGEAATSTWSALEDMALDFENLWLRLDGRKYTWIEAPAIDAINNAAQVKTQAAMLRDQLRTLVVGLESGDTQGLASVLHPTPPSAAASKRQITKMTVTGYTVDENRKRNAPQTGPRLSSDTTDIAIEMNYSGMEGAKRVAWRIYRNGKQDRLQGRSQAWTFQPSGSTTFPINYSYSSLWHFKSGYYVVEVYIDNVLMGRVDFTIGDY